MEDVVTGKQCVYCGAVTTSDGWENGECLIFGMVYACDLPCAAAWVWAELKRAPAKDEIIVHQNQDPIAES